jgi:OOP family OmpA-OmpF porin
MARIIMLAVLGVFLSIQTSHSQSKKKDQKPGSPATLPDGWEMGVGLGYVQIAKDGTIEPNSGYGLGLHFRKALDYLFSLRLEVNGALPMGTDILSNSSYETQWIDGQLLGVVTLNNLRWNAPSVEKKTNIYALVGGGGNWFDSEPSSVEGSISTHLTGGLGFALRVNEKINIGVEHQVSRVLGDRNALLNGGGEGDYLHRTGIRVNVNIGLKNKAEPLYWQNPMKVVLNDIQDLKDRPVVSLQDTDKDGVPDALDLEPNTAREAIVDTKGRTLDSDKDGVPDHLDLQPFYTPRQGEYVNSEGVVEELNGQLTEERVKALIEEAIEQRMAQGSSANAEWFLPMIHFDIESTTIKYADYGTLANIGRLLQSSPEVNLVVIGHADQTGDARINNSLSYARAASVIRHLVTEYNLSRNRFILQWRGKNQALVPSDNNLMNRRVEFKIAESGDDEMPPPGG